MLILGARKKLVLVSKDLPANLFDIITTFMITTKMTKA